MTDYGKLTVVKLKEELKRRGLPQAGLKAALCARLEEDDAAQEAATQEEPAADPSDESEPEPTTRTEPGTDQTATPPAPKAVATQPVAPSQPEDGSPQEAIAGSTRNAQIPENATASRSGDDSPQEALVVQGEEAGKDTQPSGSLQQGGQDAQTESPPKVSHSPREAARGVPQLSPPDQFSKGLGTQGMGVDSKSGAKGLQEDRNSQGETQQDTAPLPSTETQKSQSQANVIAPQLLSDTQTTVDPEEVVEDHRKRKRRSHSPAPLTQDIAMKKLKSADGSPRVQPPDGIVELEPSTSDPTKADSASDTKPTQSPAKLPAADARFKGLFAPAPSNTADPPPAKNDVDRDVAPALHPATSTLYIRNLMRPLQVPALREHLTALAQEDGPEQTDVFHEFFVDGIKSHCLVQFSSVAAASRVRSMLHDVVWPDEKNRKPLWVDYIPEEKLPEWIKIERDAAKAWPPKRWEVIYEHNQGEPVASLQEVGTAAGREDKHRSVPAARRDGPAPKPAAPPTPKGDPGRGFRALDDLFRSTTAKPKLYFLPVAEAVVKARRERLAAGRGGGRGDEMRRFTFEEEELVDDGPEFRPGYRGGGARGGRRGGGRGDSYRGRGA